jgi:uncharacterized protein YigA (DUF484 family)
MTKTTARELDPAAVSEEVLVDYLVRHPDFFERHAGVLTRLRIPHERGGQTISLVERQVQALRDKNQQLEAKIHEFVSIAQGNDALSGKIHKLSCRLVGAHGAAQVFEALEASLREDFGASHWYGVPAERCAGTVAPDDAAFAPAGSRGRRAQAL